MTSLETLILRYFDYLESKGKTFNFFLGIAWTAFFGALDIFAPANVSFSFLYLFPIGFVTWFAGKWAGIVISFACASLWSIDNFNIFSVVSIWNVLSTVAIFCTVSVMISTIRTRWMEERALSQKDPLTSVLNIRAFYQLVEYEIKRLQRDRAPFSIAYLDVDNFKTVNDRYGHKKGDDLLKTVVTNLVESLRKTDVIARVGGDEFAVFMPATDQDAVKVAMEKVRERLQERTKSEQWETTFSIGVLTCTHGNSDLEELISIADSLMYEVKNNGRNGIMYANEDYVKEKQYSLPLMEI